jgi:Uncharacterised nucleotidyltransferase
MSHDLRHQCRCEPCLEIQLLTPSLTREDQLCLLLARGQLTPEVRTRILEFLATSLQWRVILERACSHQVYPLLYRHLRDLGFPGVPEAMQSELKGLYLANGFRNQLLAEELARLLNLLDAAGIRAIPLKGVALAQSLYSDTAVRVCADTDILVPPADLPRTIELILASGYRSESGDPFFTKLILRHGRHYDAVREGPGISFLLEVHWILVQHSSKDNAAVSDLWAEARPQDYFGAPGFALSPEWEFLYLALHAADHEWRSLKWVIDIHELASSGRVSWEKVRKKTEQFEIGLPIGQTLAVTSHLLETSIPSCFSPATMPARVGLFPYMAPVEDPKNAYAFRHLRLLKRPLDKVRYFATILFAPKLPDLEFVRLPPSLGWLYYVLRPVRLAGKWSCHFLRIGSAPNGVRE